MYYKMGMINSKKSLYANDKQWANLASWGKDVGVNTWGTEIVQMKTIHPKLFMGSRLSAQQVIDKGKLSDQDGNMYDARKFRLVCIASESTCRYCTSSSKYTSYNMQDRQFTNDEFLKTAIRTAKHIHRHLKWGRYVIVHCHSGRNRSALAILVYCALYTDKTYEVALNEIRVANSSRFQQQSTLQNSKFTSVVSKNWTELQKNKPFIE